MQLVQALTTAFFYPQADSPSGINFYIFVHFHQVFREIELKLYLQDENQVHLMGAWQHSSHPQQH